MGSEKTRVVDSEVAGVVSNTAGVVSNTAGVVKKQSGMHNYITCKVPNMSGFRCW